MSENEKGRRRRRKASELPLDWKPEDSGVVLDDESRLEGLAEILAEPEPVKRGGRE